MKIVSKSLHVDTKQLSVVNTPLFESSSSLSHFTLQLNNELRSLY